MFLTLERSEIDRKIEIALEHKDYESAINNFNNDYQCCGRSVTTNGAREMQTDRQYKCLMMIHFFSQYFTLCNHKN